MFERWKPIEGYEKKYEISNCGNVKIIKTNKLKIPQKSKNGYLMINLYIGKNPKRVYIHRLVAKAFIENPNNYKDVNHKDGNKLNNYVDNLEWCTRSQNLKHAYKNKLKVPSSQVLTIEQVKYIKQNPKNLTRKQLAKELNISYWAICNIYQGRTFKEVS